MKPVRIKLLREVSELVSAYFSIDDWLMKISLRLLYISTTFFILYEYFKLMRDREEEREREMGKLTLDRPGEGLSSFLLKKKKKRKWEGLLFGGKRMSKRIRAPGLSVNQKIGPWFFKISQESWFITNIPILYSHGEIDPSYL